MSNKIDQFITRLPKGAPTIAFDHIGNAFQLAQKAAAQISAIRADTNLSRAGQAVAIEKALTGGLLGHLQQIRADVDKRLSDAVGQRAVLRDRTMKAQNFDALQKSEARQMLSRMPADERRKMALSGDPLLTEAIMNAPAYLSGLDDEVYSRIATQAVEESFGQHLKEIDVLEQTFETARAAVQTATDDVRRSTEFEPAEFARLAA
jgi:hypothetical protein